MNTPEPHVCPSLLTPLPAGTAPHAAFSEAALAALFDGQRVSPWLDFPSPAGSMPQGKPTNTGRLSLSGAQPKFGLLLDSTGRLRYSAEGEQSTHILKPRPVGYQIINHDECAANEHLTMQLASRIYGIETAPNAILFFSDGQKAYVTRRFDVHPGGKYAMEDFASLMGITKANGGSDYKYNNGSYEECGLIIKRFVKAWRVDLLKFFRLVLFNFITLNDDAHLKNFTLICRNGEYRLAPAYDLINTSLQITTPRIFALDRGLFREGMHLTDTHHVSALSFLEFGKRLGLPEKLVEQHIKSFAKPNAAAEALVGRSFLSAELRRQYLLGYRYRQTMISL